MNAQEWSSDAAAKRFAQIFALRDSQSLEEPRLGINFKKLTKMTVPRHWLHWVVNIHTCYIHQFTPETTYQHVVARISCFYTLRQVKQNSRINLMDHTQPGVAYFVTDRICQENGQSLFLIVAYTYDGQLLPWDDKSWPRFIFVVPDACVHKLSIGQGKKRKQLTGCETVQPQSKKQKQSETSMHDTATQIAPQSVQSVFGILGHINSPVYLSLPKYADANPNEQLPPSLRRIMNEPIIPDSTARIIAQPYMQTTYPRCCTFPDHCRCSTPCY